MRSLLKICSLLPSATEIVYSMGLGEDVVAVSHECDYPPEVSAKPRITRSNLHIHADSRSVSMEVARLRGKVSELDEELLLRLNPDLILTQELCEVCALSYANVVRSARMMLGSPRIVSLEPHRLDDILDNIVLVGEVCHRNEEASGLVQELRKRIEFVRSKSSSAKRRPRVLCVEWLAPVWIAGHWVPDMIEIAGGKHELGLAGRPSRPIDWEEVLLYEPEIIILMPCGFGLKKVLASLDELSSNEGWSRLPAVKDRRVYAVDASSYFSRPGLRIVEGLEIAAQLLHPELFSYDLAGKGSRAV